MERRTSPGAAPGGAPLDETKDDDQLAAAAWRAMDPPWQDLREGDPVHAAGGGAYLPRGAVVGRYVVLRELGAGGMGVVYAAYDPELDRKVALKLVLPGKGDAEGRTRLLREAQVLAKLSHRNVVGIYDVGTMDEQVWLAMELVRGQTLRAWLKEPREWPDVLRVMRRAARGLAAAHAAGLLHRDFKPDNVMLARDGQVRVMDFGLARARASLAKLAAEESTLEAVPVVDTLAMGVTDEGTLLGTPRYMAPEQLADGELTPAIDQYALCVTLWEGLYGERPFGGETLEALVDNVLAGRLQEPTHRRAVPSWLRRVCERGLSIEPRQRFASMEALLDALAKGRARARVRRGVLAMGALALLGAGTEGYRRYDIARRTAACEASGAEVELAWSPAREQALYDGLVATGASYAPTTAEKVMPWLDRQAEAWREARVDACLDAEVRGGWDAQTLDRSLWCLDERRMELQSLVDELTVADAAVVQKAVTAATGLVSVASCRDEGVLETLVPLPDENREAVRAVRADLTRVASLSRAGRFGPGLELARGALERARALQWPPLVAAARWRLGSLLHKTGAYAEAETVLADAYFEAADGVAPEVAFFAANDLVLTVSDGLARPAQARRWSRHAEVALAGVRDGEQLRRANWLDNLAGVQITFGDYDEAKRSFEQSVAIFEALGSDHPSVATGLNNLATAHTITGGYDEAKALYGRALVILEQALGPEHPDVAKSLGNLANVSYMTGDYHEAKALYERALSIKEQALGPTHPDVATTRGNLGNAYFITGGHAEAKALHESALVILEKVLGPEHPDVAVSLNNLGSVHRELGDYEAAKATHERALAIREKTLGPAHPEVAASLGNLAIVHRALGDYAEAKALHERALVIREQALGPEHPSVVYSLLGLAEVALGQGRPAEALAPALRAVAVWEKGGVAAEQLARVRFVLAQALWDAPAAAGRDRPRATTLATQARDVFRVGGKGSADNLATVEQWLGEHATRP